MPLNSWLCTSISTNQSIDQMGSALPAEQMNQLVTAGSHSTWHGGTMLNMDWLHETVVNWHTDPPYLELHQQHCNVTQTDSVGR